MLITLVRNVDNSVEKPVHKLLKSLWNSGGESVDKTRVCPCERSYAS